MHRRSSTIVHALALSVALSGALSPAQAGGLISTERAAAQEAAAAPDASIGSAAVAPALAAAQRSRLQATLVEGGVDAGQAALRLAALSDAEVAELTHRIDNAPAGGLWFMPFLVVAAVIGVLISTREAGPSGPATTDLFGRPRSIATAP